MPSQELFFCTLGAPGVTLESYTPVEPSSSIKKIGLRKSCRVNEGATTGHLYYLRNFGSAQQDNFTSQCISAPPLPPQLCHCLPEKPLPHSCQYLGIL